MSTAAPLQNTAVKSPPVSKSSHAGLLLQRKCACGVPLVSSLSGKCEACKKNRLQAKLTIGASNDPLEQEADRVADQVLAEPVNPLISGAVQHIQRFTEESTGQTDAAPTSIERVLASSGRPLDPAIQQDMGQRFGHDFSQVQVHTGAAAEKSAREVNAHAYTVGHNIVFGEGQFTPNSYSGRHLIAHELTHVVQQTGSNGIRLGQSNDKRDLSPISHVAQPFVPNVVRRDLVTDAAGNFVSYEFRIGHELTEAFVKKAKKLTADGTLDNADIEKLKADATAARDTVSDHERMFMAGLLDAANVTTLQATTINSKASITFALSTVTDARVRQVIKAGQPAVPASVSMSALKLIAASAAGDFSEMRKQSGKLQGAADKEIRLLVGASFKTQITAVLAFAQAQGVPLSDVLGATLTAASDDTPSDRLMAAAAYVTAAAVAHPLATDMRTGKIRMDALAPAKFTALPGVKTAMRAMYVAAAPINPSLAGLKGDTIYMPTDFDITNLADRSTVIHELRHAQDDKAAAPTGKSTSPALLGLEVTAYKAEARYILDQMHGQATAERVRSAKQVGTGAGALQLWGVLIEAKTDLTKYQPLVEEIFAAAPWLPSSARSATGVAKMLAVSAANLESLLQADILKTGITSTTTGVIEGQAGESLIHWVHRL